MSKQENIIALAKQELPTLAAVLRLNTVQGTDNETIVLQELEYLQQIGLSMPALYECLPQTIIAGIKSVLKQNLTFDPAAGLVYVKTRNVKVNNQWVPTLEVQPTANGIISINRQCGRILDIDRPEVIKDKDGKVIGVKVTYLTPSFNENGEKCNRWKTVEFDESDFQRWRTASHKENSRGKDDAATKDYSNINYRSFKGGIDPEFARAKAIRHGLKKLGTNPHEKRAVQIITEVEKKHVVDTEADVQAMADDNGHVYTEFEEAPAPTKVHVEMHEEIEL